MPNISDRRGGGDFLIKVGRDVRRVQNLGRAKSARKPNARAKSAQKPNDRASFQKLQSPKIWNFVKNCQKPNARAKFSSQNLMTGQKLTPEIPNARARTSVPTFIRDPVSDLPAFLYK